MVHLLVPAQRVDARGESVELQVKLCARRGTVLGGVAAIVAAARLGEPWVSSAISQEISKEAQNT